MHALLFCVTILLSSFLLFIVQPLVGRMLLPSLGGTPAVWNTCVVFFQAVLLAGYGYTHYVSSRLKPRNQVILHFCLLAVVCFALPIRTYTSIQVPTDSDPTFWLLLQLALMVGIPFFVISSNAPLLQRWYSYVLSGKAAKSENGSEEKNNDPYFLYAISNVGSLAALFSYPFFIEPTLGISSQSVYWLGTFLLLVIGFLGCGWAVFSSNYEPTAEKQQLQTPSGESLTPSQLWKQRLYWIALAAVPSSLMLGVTSYLTIDVGSLPLLWVIPLAIYLLTFVFAFANKQIIPHKLMVRMTPPMVLLMALLLLVDLGSQPWLIAPFHLLTFFVIAMMCHGEMNRLRPGVDRLTEFYLWLSVGGFVGGMFNALIAPNLFNGVYEYPLALVAACALMPRLGRGKTADATVAERDATESRWQVNWVDFAWPVAIAVFGFIAVAVADAFQLENKMIVGLLLFCVPAMICYGFVERPLRFALTCGVIIFSCSYHLVDSDVIVSERGFFGVNKVTVDEENGFRSLINGKTMHGLQLTDPAKAQDPISYYHPTGPVGDIFTVARKNLDIKNVAVVGLGTGCVATYSQPGQKFDFYEIDPLVCKFASDPKHFSFLENSKGDCELIVGDGRVQMRNRITQSDDQYDMIFLDAFSSDAIPMHLVTLEAFELYDRCLSENGMLVMNITNKHIDLRPLLDAISKVQGWTILARDHRLIGDHTENEGKLSSSFTVLTRNKSCQEDLLASGNWDVLKPEKQIKAWTDEFSNFLDIIAW